MKSTLPISRLVNVAVNLSPQAAQAQSLSSLLVLGTSAVIDLVTRMREYFSLADVGTDFGTTSEEYLAASMWFGQNPQPPSILIGRWAEAAAAGQLVSGALNAAQQDITVWNAVTTGSFKLTVDAGAATDYTGLNFGACANMAAVAAVIDTAITAVADCAWDAVYSRFVITSKTTGAASLVSYMSAAVTGVDISAMANGTQATGAYRPAGQAAESALAAVTLFDNQYGQQWYGLVIPSAAEADHLAVASMIEGLTTKHLYGVTTQDSNTLVAGDTTCLAYQLKALAYDRTTVQYSSSSAYTVVSMLARILTTNYTENNSTITLMYKQEPGIVAENLSATALAALEAKNCNVFVAYNNDTAIIEKGQVASGAYVDEITGTDWLAVSIQVACFNVLYLSATKIPQTDAGQHILATVIAGVCSQAVDNGLLGPGTWTANGFGLLKTGDPLPTGFYIYTPLISTQSVADRAARKSVPIQIAAKLAGAVHTVDITINVNR